MAKPRRPYMTKGQKRVPSVTTVLGKFKDPGPLMYWSWNLAYEQLQHSIELLENKVGRQQINKFLKTNPLELANYRGVSKTAAEAGTLAHDLVEMWIHAVKGERLKLARQTPKQLASVYRYPEDVAEKAHSSFQGFIEWAHQWKLSVIATEERLVCEEFRYGGTIDCVATIGPKSRRQVVLLDWKTSKGVYSDYLCQVAAYGHMWNEHHPEKEIESYHLVRFDKETGDYHHHHWQEVSEALELFLNLRRCYELEKVVSKRVK
jgi:hypothetical protein